MKCVARGIAMLESLAALVLFSILVIVSFQALQYLSHWYSQLTMHRLALHQLENFSDWIFSTQGIVNEKKMRTHWLTWDVENKHINSRFSSQFRCQSARCTLTLIWNSKKSIQQDTSPCHFLTDACVQLHFSVKPSV